MTDKGIGIGKEYRQKIFDTFFRVSTGDVHDVKGFGLGLAYTKKIVALHEGTIAIESGKGKGTTFTVTLPGKNDYFLGRSLDVFITKIRRYLQDDPEINIENVFEVGFIFNVPGHISAPIGDDRRSTG